jgi:hypothetical protein
LVGKDILVSPSGSPEQAGSPFGSSTSSVELNFCKGYRTPFEMRLTPESCPIVGMK